MKHPHSKGISRRNFLGQASCAAVGSTALYSTLLNLAMSGRAAAAVPSNEYRALVCLFLGGGNDSYNMLSPLETDEYNAYKSIRADLALDGSTPELTPLPISDAGGRAFGIHPSMPEIRDLYDAGNLAFVANTGTLIRPTTLSDYEQKLDLPKGLFSHADQIKQWQTSVPQGTIGKGWGGRTADLLYSLNSNNQIAMNISLGGANVFQTGSEIIPYAIGSDGSVKVEGLGGTTAIDIARTAAVTSQLDIEYANLFEKTFVEKTKKSKDAADFFQNIIDSNTLSTPLDGSDLESDLAMVARSIKAAPSLGHTRQTFFVFVGGWDHHSDTIANQQSMLGMVSQAVGRFHDALVEIGMLDQVTLFQASDFGRTLNSNGKGSDHAWGGNYFVMGGGVNGGDVYGSYPNLADIASINTGRGRLIPSASVDEYASELVQWLGVQQSDLSTVLPNIGSFPGATDPHPLGFLA